jgi:tetratricopeptide (TPR) repeat protein
MAWMKETAYQKQIIIYLNNRAYQQACDFSKEYVTAYPNDMSAHFLAAKAGLKCERFEEAASEARLAFNLAKTEEDMTMCAVHAAVAYYRLGQYRKGYEIIRATDGFKACQEIEELAFLLCLALDLDCEGAVHFRNMFTIDKPSADRFIMALADGVPIDYERILKAADRFN